MWQRQQPGKDVDTIRWWIEQFRAGADTVIWVNKRNLDIPDGNHRLIAAHYAGVKTIKVRYPRG